MNTFLTKFLFSSEREMHIIQRHYPYERVQDRSTFTVNIQEVVGRLSFGVLDELTGVLSRLLAFFFFLKFGVFKSRLDG